MIKKTQLENETAAVANDYFALNQATNLEAKFYISHTIVTLKTDYRKRAQTHTHTHFHAVWIYIKGDRNSRSTKNNNYN